MARQESDRDDLWAEAVALTSRVEWAGSAGLAPVVAGFRDNGWFSIYFGQDVVLQFTSDGSLRRAYRDGILFRTQGTTLARLERRRGVAETTLVRRDLTPEELAEFRHWTRELVAELAARLSRGELHSLRETNRGPQPLGEAIVAILERILTTDRFLAPAIPGKR